MSDCGHDHDKPIFLHLGVEDFILQDKAGGTISPAVVSITDYTDERLADGFEGNMTVIVYPRLQPSVLMCFVWRGFHMHLFSMNEGAQDVLNIMAWLIQNPESSKRTVDQLLRHTFDTMPIPQRMMQLVVPSPEDIAKAN